MHLYGAQMHGWTCTYTAHLRIYISIYLSISLSLSIYIYIYIYIHMYTCTHTLSLLYVALQFVYIKSFRVV